MRLAVFMLTFLHVGGRWVVGGEVGWAGEVGGGWRVEGGGDNEEVIHVSETTCRVPMFQFGSFSLLGWVGGWVVGGWWEVVSIFISGVSLF